MHFVFIKFNHGFESFMCPDSCSYRQDVHFFIPFKDRVYVSFISGFVVMVEDLSISLKQSRLKTQFHGSGV